MATPIATPSTAEISRPTTSGCSVMAKAWKSEKSAIIDQSATMVALKVGKAKLIGIRAAPSQTRQMARPERTRSVSG